MLARIALVVTLVGSIGSAAAESTPSTKIFPLASQKLSKSRRDVPDALTTTLAKTLEAGVASAPIEAAADLYMCQIPQPSCLEKVTKSVNAQRIVYGVVTGRTTGGVSVKLAWFSKDGQDEKTFVLTGDTTDDLALELQQDLKALRGTLLPERGEVRLTGKKGEDDNGEVVVVKRPRRPVEKPSETPIEEPTPTPPVDDEVTSSGTITTGTYAMIIGGGAAAGVGVGLIVSSQLLKKDIATAPTKTRTDILRLQQLERAGKLRLEIGAGLAIAGGAVAIAGAVRAVIQHREPRRESPTFTVMPEQGGGASLIYTRGF